MGRKIKFFTGERRRGGKTVHTVELLLDSDRLDLLAFFEQADGINRDHLSAQEYVGAFLAGAYLACGNTIDPEKGYHMEFVVRENRLCNDFAALLEEVIPGAKVSFRRQSHIVYYKECGSMEDLLTLMGATKSCLKIIDIETYKSVRNRANRVTNCETANIDKLVGAAASQIDDILLVFDMKGEDCLPQPLLEAARLRLRNPEASLRELTELSPVPISRSGLHHRLERIGKMAEEIRELAERGEGSG